MALGRIIEILKGMNEVRKNTEMINCEYDSDKNSCPIPEKKEPRCPYLKNEQITEPS